MGMWDDFDFGGGSDWNSGFDLPGGGDTPIDWGSLLSGSWGMGDRGLGSTEDGTAGGYTGGPSGFNIGNPWEQFKPGNGGPGMLSGLGKMLGLTGKDGSLDISGLLPLLGIGAGAFNQYHATDKASQQMQDAINNSNKIITDTLAPNKELYEPYRAAGLGALTKMQNAAPSNLAGQFAGGLSSGFGSLGSGKGIKLSQMAKGGR